MHVASSGNPLRCSRRCPSLAASLNKNCTGVLPDFKLIAAVGSTLFLTTDFDVMARASFLDRVITMQLDSKYRRNLVFCQSVIARKSP